MCCTRLAENTAKKSPKIRHLHAIAQLYQAVSSQLRHVSEIGKKLLNSNISSARPNNMANFGPLTAEINSGVWGTPANFNGFRLLHSLLHRRRSPEANQTLQDVWQSPAPTFGGSCPLTEFCLVQNSLYAQVLSFAILAELLHSTPAGASARLCGVVQGMELRTFTEGATYIRLHSHHVGKPMSSSC